MPLLEFEKRAAVRTVFRHLRARKLRLRPQRHEGALVSEWLCPGFGASNRGGRSLPSARALTQQAEPGCLANNGIATQSDFAGDLPTCESGTNPVF
jgi:hypothetical protein